ncbi:MAG: uncharacterized protein PWP08_340 [Methanofollis sp.]|nr:uncharacterized protein [Methanofollis sp.]
MYERALENAGCDPGVIAHCRAVTGMAREYARSTVVDRQLLEVGAMLHDLGRSKTHGPGHAGAGAELATAMGCPDGVVRIVGRHLGAGLTLEESALLGLLPGDAMPVCLEERIVAHADNLVKGTREISAEERWDRSIALGKKYLVRAFRLGLDLEPLRHLR